LIAHAYAATTSARAVYDEQFRLVDRTTGEPLRGVRYWITSSAGETNGITDGNGRTQRVVTQQPEKLKLEIDTGDMNG
jgi:hypothetical protein